MKTKAKQLEMKKNLHEHIDAYSWVLLFWAVAIFFSPLNHDLKRYSLPLSLVWNDSGFLFIFPFLFSFFLLSKKQIFSMYKKFVHVFFIIFLLTILLFLSPIHSYIPYFRYLIFLIIPILSFPILRRVPWLFALTLIGVLTLQSQWAIFQFISQHDVGMNILGESHLSASTIGVAKFSVASTKLIRAYGPYQHANMLSGSLLVGIILCLYLLSLPKQVYKPYLLLTCSIITIGFITAFSRSALLSLVIFLLVFFISIKKVFKNKISFPTLATTLIFIFLLIFSPLLFSRSTDSQDLAYQARNRGYTWGVSILQSLPAWHGVGMGNYPKTLEHYLVAHNISYESWEIESVHNSFLLLILELGILPTFLIVIILLYRATHYGNKLFSYRNIIFISSLLPIFLLDHYMLTSTTPLVITELVWVTVMFLQPDSSPQFREEMPSR